MDRRSRAQLEEIKPAERRTPDAILALAYESGFPPKAKELAEGVGITPAGTHYHRTQLTHQGHQGRAARGPIIMVCPEMSGNGGTRCDG